jgi:hypothetical protein
LPARTRRAGAPRARQSDDDGHDFLEGVDTDILFDYGIFSPRCRSADLTDMRKLDLRINVPNPRVTGDKLFPDWKSALATLTAAASAVK